MQVLDIILLVLFIPAIIHGAAKGLVTQIVSLVSVFVGAIVAGRFAPDLTQIAMLQFGSEERVTYILCFIVIFLACALVMALVGHLITKLFKAAALGWLNRLIGGIFGAAKWMLIVAVIILCIDMLDGVLHFIRPEVKEGSLLYPYGLKLMQSLKQAIVA